MAEKLTIGKSAGRKKSLKQPEVAKPQKDKWLDKTAGSYHTGKKDIMADLFKDISK